MATKSRRPSSGRRVPGNVVSATAINAAISAQNLERLVRALDQHEGAIPAKAILNCGRLAWLPGFKALVKHGADLNASFKHYRALHAVIQEKPHVGRSSMPARVACVKWLLAHGADPELMAAWPAARALIIAAFQGEPAYVRAIRGTRQALDVFEGCALGNVARVRKLVAADPSLANARDGGVLTALQCCGGSRLGARDPKIAAALLECARILLDAGADVNALAPSWGHEVSAAYLVIRTGQIDTLRLLLGRGLDATEAVSTAAWENRSDILDILIEHGGDVNMARDGSRPLLNELIRWGQFSQARLLLARGASANLADDRGWTAVHQVVSRGNLKMLADVLEAGGDPHRAGEDGRTPRGMAKKSGRADLLAAIDSRRAGTPLADPYADGILPRPSDSRKAR